MDPNPKPHEAQNTQYLTTIPDPARLSLAKERIRAGSEDIRPAFSALCDEADAWRGRGPFSVTHKTLNPPSGDKHDYLSFGSYWWPDPASKDGLPYVRRDGEVNPETIGLESDRVRLESMGSGAETLALAYYFTGDEKYARRSELFITTWFLESATRMNPHLKYGQAIPGRCEGRGIGLIDTKRFSQVINAVALLDDLTVFSHAQREALVDWFKTYLQWMLESPHGRDESKQHNNHGTWYDVQIAHYALFTGNRGLAKSVLESAMEKRLASHVKPDGSQPHELARTRSFTYSLLNLSGLLALAELGKQVGVDFWSCTGESGESLLRAAIDFLAAYADPRNPWTHRQITEFRAWELFPFLRQARAYTGDNRYEDYCRLLPREAVENHRANLLWPIA